MGRERTFVSFRWWVKIGKTRHNLRACFQVFSSLKGKINSGCSNYHLLPKTIPSTNTPVLESCVEARQESAHSPIMRLPFLCRPLSADERRCLFHAPLLLPLFPLSIESGRVVRVTPKFGILAFYSLSCLDQSVHRKLIVATPSGRLPACDAKSIFILILQRSHSSMFWHFALAPVFTSPPLHVVLQGANQRSQGNVRFIILLDRKSRCSCWISSF